MGQGVEGIEGQVLAWAFTPQFQLVFIYKIIFFLKRHVFVVVDNPKFVYVNKLFLLFLLIFPQNTILGPAGIGSNFLQSQKIVEGLQIGFLICPVEFHIPFVG